MALRKQEPEAYELLDQRDEEQILSEIKGNIITEMFYSFKMEGREVTGISWVGTKEIARQYGGINIDYVDLKETPLSYMAIVKATDTKRGTSLLGTAMQSKTMISKGEEVNDKFASTKAISKAQRNAIRAIIPEKYLLEMYKAFKEGPKSEKPQPRKQVESEAKTVQPKTIDPDEERVRLTLESNNLNEDVSVQKYGKVVQVLPGAGFPRDMKEKYDHVLVKLMAGKWLGLENRWEVPF